MKIVIKIPEEDYDDILNGETKASALNWSTFNAIRNGTPLPEHHGRIIDESQIKSVYYHEESVMIKGFQLKNLVLDHTDAPTIIEADERSDSGE